MLHIFLISFRQNIVHYQSSSDRSDFVHFVDTDYVRAACDLGRLLSRRNRNNIRLNLYNSSHIPNPLSRIIIRFWETAHLPLPQANINTHISVRANLGLRGGVGGQTGPRNVCDVLTEENANFCPSNRFRPGVLGLLKPF